jgi:hypothetical protein
MTSTAPAPTIVSEWRRELISVLPHNRAHRGALRAAVAIVTPISVLTLTGHASLTLFATFGAMAGVFGRHSTYSARLRLQIAAGLSLSSSVFVGTLVGLVAPASSLAVVAIAVISAVGLLISRRIGLLPVPSLFLVFATGSTSAYQHQPIDLVWAAALPLLAATFAVLLGQAGRILNPSPAGRHPLRAVVSFREIVRAPGVRVDLLRYAVGPLAAGAIATAVGIGHPYWAAVAATVPLTGVTLGAQLGRGTQRLAGTVIGVALAALLLSLDPPLLVLIAIVAAAQLWAELFIMRNYALATIGVTPLALVMIHLASPAPLGQLVSDRLIETGIGVAVAVVLLIATTPRAARASRRRRAHPTASRTTSETAR